VQGPSDVMRMCKVPLGRTYGRILDFSFGSRTGNGHERAFELVSGVDLRCPSTPCFERDPLKGVVGQVWPENGPKPTKAKIYGLVS
jgi:hypothetical protein